MSDKTLPTPLHDLGQSDFPDLIARLEHLVKRDQADVLTKECLDALKLQRDEIIRLTDEIQDVYRRIPTLPEQLHGKIADRPRTPSGRFVKPARPARPARFKRPEVES